jgi:hypothetical protein
MMIKVLIFYSGLSVISQIEEIFTDPGEADCRLINPYEILENGEELKKWPSITNQTSIEIHSKNVLTIVDPKKELIKKYFELTAE